VVRANLDYFNAALQKAKRDAASPFGALDHLIRAYFDFARRFPLRYRFLLEVSHEDSPLGAEVRQAFEAVIDFVRAAQQANEIKGGDPKHISALIYGAAYGMADLAVLNREGVVLDLAPLLLDLLAAREHSL
jgi:AcrR family transcriptional regulator